MPATLPTDSSSSFSYAPGDLIAGKYELGELLGEGGMGAVFRARNTSLDMQVAIKLLRSDLNRGFFAGRLLHEARAAAMLTHPAIVRVFDVGQTALGDPFIVMELLEGETLAQVIEREERLTPIHAVQLLLPLADALCAAHAKGLVHRDFKPDNVLLVVSDGGTVQPKLLDFGVVKCAQLTDAQGTSDAGTVVGSPDYMSPEQASGLEQVDARSDLWSFSVVLYELLAGVPPFQATDYAGLLRQIVHDHPRSLEERGVADRALSAIVSRGLSKDPAARYASASEMGTALAAWLLDQGILDDACGVSIERKWLARITDPQELGRKSWPPARSEQISGIREVGLTRSMLGKVSLALLTLLVVCLVLLSRPRAVQVLQPSSASPPAPVSEVLLTPVSIASTVASVETAPSTSLHRAPPSKPRPAASATPKTDERLSSKLLAPLTF